MQTTGVVTLELALFEKAPEEEVSKPRPQPKVKITGEGMQETLGEEQLELLARLEVVRARLAEDRHAYSEMKKTLAKDNVCLPL